MITKLADKLEATGAGLEHVFSALAGKRKATRSLAEQRIKGLAPFDLADFRTQIEDAQDSSQDGTLSMLNDVFGSQLHRSKASIDEPAGLDDWWRKLVRGDSVTLVDRGKREAEGGDADAKRIDEQERR